MATTLTYTVLDAVTEALREAGITPWGETPSADAADEARRSLRRMLKSWQARESFDWLSTNLSHTLTTAAGQTLSPVRPVRIHGVSYKSSGNEMPMQVMTQAEYDDLPNKASTGIPTSYFYDRQREAAVLYVWPVLAAASGQTLEITYEREMPDCDDLSETLDVPAEAWDAVVYGLAARLAMTTQQNRPDLAVTAQGYWNDLLAGQNTGSVWFGEIE